MSELATPISANDSKSVMAPMTPREVVAELDKHIVGQAEAKRAVAIALRNRWRRMQLMQSGDSDQKELGEEITPKNILMIGPTGVGKTEIARRVSHIANAPFIKVEATRFTEVGYVGRDVESIIRELIDVAMKKTKDEEISRVEHLAQDAAEERILDILLPRAEDADNNTGIPQEDNSTRQIFRKRLREGTLDDDEIEMDVAVSSVGVEIMAPPGMEEMTSQLQNMFQNLSSEKTKARKMKIKDALKHAREEEATKLINEDEMKIKALNSVEQNGIVFIDEIDKVTRRSESSGTDVSREGVQRDLLPLIEGSVVSTKYGRIKTDHILFITSGAFHLSRPSDLIPELQGRLPIRVELKALTADDFNCILTEPKASLTEQYASLLGTEGVKIEFTKNGLKKIAQIAWHVNENTENIGARRLHTVMERLLEEISFTAPDTTDKKIVIDQKYVDKYLASLAKDEDLSHFIL